MLFKYDPETFRLLLAALQSNDYQLVNKRFNDMYLSFSVSVNKYIRKVYKKYQQAEIPEPVYDYNWSAEKGRDHYYTQIARDLIDKIAASTYEPGTLLPYEAVLARNYKVSISTIRKSLALLNEIGFAETINTKGTIVRLPPTFITANCMQNERYKKDTLIYHKDKNGFYVYAKPNLCDPNTVIKYIGRYLGRPVIALKRIDSYDGKNVTFHYNRHEDNTYVKRTIPAIEFIKLLIQHIPEKHFKMIRYYGLYARHREIDTKLYRAIHKSKHRFIKSFTKWRQDILKLLL